MGTVWEFMRRMEEERKLEARRVPERLPPPRRAFTTIVDSIKEEIRSARFARRIRE